MSTGVVYRDAIQGSRLKFALLNLVIFETDVFPSKRYSQLMLKALNTKIQIGSEL